MRERKTAAVRQQPRTTASVFNDDHEDDADDEADDDHAEDDTDGKQLQWHNTTRTTEGTCYH